MKFLRDLFCGPENRGWELGRILGALAIVAVIAAAVANLLLGHAIDLGVTGFPGGLAAVLTAAGAFIAAKDWARAANITAQKGEGE